MPFHFYLVPLMDQPNVASIFYGPVLLAAEESAPRTDWRPVTLDARDISKSIKGDPATLRFTIGDAALKPFFETYGIPLTLTRRLPATLDQVSGMIVLDLSALRAGLEGPTTRV